MVIQAVNNTASPITYSNLGLTISALSSLTISNSLLVDFILDPNVNADISTDNISISDTVTAYHGDSAINFLIRVLNLIGGDNLNLDQNITGNGQTVVIATTDMGAVIVDISGTFSATLSFEATVNGSNWFNWFGTSNSTTQLLQNVTGPDQVIFNAAGIQQFRVHCTAYTSGTASVSIAADQSFAGISSYVGSTAISGYSAVPVNLVGSSNTITGSVSQGTAASASGAWPTYLTDGASNTLSSFSFNNGASGSIATGSRSIAQIGVVDTHNSSTINIASGASFTGTSLVVLAHSAAEITVFADQPLTVKPEQSTDGTNWDIIDSWTVVTSTGDSRAVQIQAQYFRLVVTNTGVSSTTNFRVQTIFKPIANVLPRTLSQSGNLKTAISEAIPAGTNLVGKVGIDQTTVGTTNAISIAQLGSTTVSTGNGTTNAGTLRVSLSSDSTGQVAVTGITNALPAGTNLLGKTGIDQTTPGTTNAVSLSQLGSNTIATGNGTTSTGTLRVSLSSDSTGQVSIAAGSATIGALTANQSVNLNQIAGTTTLTGNGTTGAGSQRVTIASDNTAFSVNAIQSGTWTVQPGNTPNTSPWLMKPHDGSNPLYTAAAVLADAVSNPTEGRHATDNYLFNGSTWDRQRNNVSSGAAIDTESLSGAGTTNGATQTNYNARGAMFTFVSSALSGTSPTVTISVQYSYDGGTTFVTVPGATTTAIASATTTTLQVYPGISTTANSNVSSILPRKYRLQYIFTGSSTPKMTVNSFVDYVV